MPSLTIIVPFYNEARTLKQLISDLDNVAPGICEKVIFVNDGSEDNSEQVLKDALEHFSIPSTYVYKTNGGKASAVLEGLNNCESTHAVILDADLELDVSDLIKMWELIEFGKADAVFGYREFRSHSSYTYRYAKGNKVISNFYGFIFNHLITDIMCGYKMFPVDLKNNLPRKISGYSIEIAIPSVLWKLGVKPHEVEVSYKPRNRHEGKIINSFDGIKVLVSIIKFRLGYRVTNN